MVSLQCHTFILVPLLLEFVAAVVIDKADPLFVTDERYRNYRLEDFFWTGTEDGPLLEDAFNFSNETTPEEEDTSGQGQAEQPWRTTTVFHTSTILFATIYPSRDSCRDHGCSPQVTPVWTESIDLSSPAVSSIHEIMPTPTQQMPRTSTPETPLSSRDSGTVQPAIEDITSHPWSELEISPVPTPYLPVPPDQRYWLLTVLRTEEGPELRTSVLADRLAKLYQRAFMRGRREKTGQVQVVIHNATGSTSGTTHDVGLLYTVSVSGQPVPAVLAAADMRLLTVSEVSAELGYPVLTKAERKQPAAYLKSDVPFGARVHGRSRETWLLIGAVVAAVILLVVVAALFTLGLSKKRAKRSARGAANKRQVHDSEEGNTNLAFVGDGKEKSNAAGKVGEPSPSVTFADQRRDSTSSSCTGSSEASLVRIRMQQRRKDDLRPKPRPRTRVRRVDDLQRGGDEEHGLASARSDDIINDALDDVDSVLGPSPRRGSTPTSYLSMPSVKAFPRKARIPETLNRVLEPISIRHLDVDDPYAQVSDGPVEATNQHVKVKLKVTRHGSLEGDDPGVIGPVVWDRHCQHISALHREDASGTGSIGRMRRRFNDLLDDTFNMFSSRSQSPVLERSQRVTDTRAKSAIVQSDAFNAPSTRPKTTDSKRPQTAMTRTPRGAWATPHAPSPARPLSAAAEFVRKSNRNIPAVDPALILVDSDIPPSDPAVPLIAAIKEELKKFQRSGSDNSS